jgi:hypothetical protein
MIVTTLLFLTLLVAVAVPDKADLGPFVATFDMGVPTGDYNVEINPSQQFKDYNSYWFQVHWNSGKGFIDVNIDDYGKTIDVSSNKLNEILQDDPMWEWTAEKTKMVLIPLAMVGGRPAVAGKGVNKTTGETEVYEAIYSPDGVGSSGTILCTIVSFYPDKKTDAFLGHLQTRRQ